MSRPSKRSPTSLPAVRRHAPIPGTPSELERELFANHPTGRRQVQLLDQWLNRELEANQYTDDPLNAVKQAQQLYSVCFDELLRQVRAGCGERGELMEKIWMAYLELFENILTMREHEREGYNARIREHQDHYQQLYKEKDVHFSKMYLQLAAEKEKMLMGKDKLDRYVTLLNAEHHRWLERDDRMKRYLKRLRAQVDKHYVPEDEERPVYLLDLIEQPGFKESNTALVQKLEMVFARLSELSGLLTDSAVPLEALVLDIDAQVSAIKECCLLLTNGPEETPEQRVEPDPLEEQKSFSEKSTQTRPLSAQGSESGAKPVPDLFRPYFLQHYYGDSEPVSEEWLLRLIAHLFLRKLRADEEADSRMEPHEPFAAFLYEEFLSLYGLRRFAERRLLEVLNSLDKYLDRPRIRVFAQFCALLQPDQTPHTNDLDVYLYALSLCYQALADETEAADDFSLTYDKALDVLKAVYGESSDTLIGSTPRDHKSRFDIDTLLEVVVRESCTRTLQIEARLVAQLESELNESPLSFGSFVALVRRVNALHKRSERELLAVYREAQERSGSYKLEVKQVVAALHSHELVAWRTVPFQPVSVAADVRSEAVYAMLDAAWESEESHASAVLSTLQGGLLVPKIAGQLQEALFALQKSLAQRGDDQQSLDLYRAAMQTVFLAEQTQEAENV